MEDPTGTSRAWIWRTLINAGPSGLTDFELKERSGYRAVSQRRSELVKKGFVRDTGRRKVNPSSKTRQTIWTAFDVNGNRLHPPPSSADSQDSKGSAA